MYKSTQLSQKGIQIPCVKVGYCLSRLRLILTDTTIVNENVLKKTGSMGIVKIDNQNIQVVYGGKVEEATRVLKNEMKIVKQKE